MPRRQRRRHGRWLQRDHLDCNGQNNQKWRLNSNGTITAVGANKCLDVSGYGTANGSKVHIWSCHGGTNQQWTRV